MTVDLSGKIALITGASRGIGAAVAKGYARAGAHVILLARTVGALEEIDDEIQAAGGTATLMPLDLVRHNDLDKLGPAIAEKFGQLDIFVANAGMLGTLSPLTHIRGRDFQKVFDINVNTNFRLIRTLDPLLKGAKAGRAIFVTSGMSHICKAYWGPYAASKAAMEAMVKVYAAEVEKTNLRVNLIRPGAVDTALLNEAYPGGYDGPTKKPEDVVPAFLDLASPECKKHGELVDLSEITPHTDSCSSLKQA